MKNVLPQAATKPNKSYRQKKWWQRIVSAMTAFVVFCTTYALILPALTMEGETICGFEAHEHTESCYIQQQEYVFSCDLGDQTRVVHSHDSHCYDAQGALICALPEISEHIHGEACMASESVLVCELEESEGHAHSEVCGSAESVLVCTAEEAEGHTHGEGCGAVSETVLVCALEESEGHAHSDSCSPVETVLICGTEESEAHTHGETCYETRQTVCELPESEGHAHGETCWEIRTTVTCGMEESGGHAHGESCYEIRQTGCDLAQTEGHTHGEGCYEMQTSVACGMAEVALHTHDETCVDCLLPQIAAHSHTDSCLTLETLQELICEIPVHIHEDSCYPVEEDGDASSEYLCGSGEHTHGEECYNADGSLHCTIPLHTHDLACVVEGYDLNADVETRQQWEDTLSHLTLTGNWAGDVLAVAETQLGYQESRRNVTLVGEELKGYTRYGQWYGSPYGDWCAMFASFCLHYAGVEDFPLEASCERWIEILTEQGLYLPAGLDTPAPGDLIFFDYDQVRNGTASDHVGIVAELIPDEGKVRTIEGNTGDKVAYMTYDLDDSRILGYGRLPLGKTIVLTHQGADYTVTVTFGQEAGIPETAQLAVHEILPGTDEYDTYYQQSVEAMLHSGTAQTEEELAVSFARFFDISFLVDGFIVEPAAPVSVQISYHDGIRQTENESGVAVHFADSGIEVLDAETSQSAAEQTDNIDTFAFQQGSFSVVGTVLSAYERVVSSTATRVEPYEIDDTAATLYVLYTQINGRYYALDGNGNAVAVTVSGNTVDLGANASNDLFWTFKTDGGNYSYNPIANLGTSRYLHPFNNGGGDTGITTANPYGVSLTVSGSTFKIRGNNNYVRFDNATSAARAVTDVNQASSFYAAAVGRIRNVWFDGTNGGMMSYYGADNINIPALVAGNGVSDVTLPEEWNGSTKYPYKLRGWYDINTQTYYPVDPADGQDVVARLTQDTVFYADWIAATYDVGQDNDHAVDSLDTSDFITTHVFDYNALFNVLSQTHTGTISAANHSETWTVHNNGETVPYQNGKSLGFVFVDYDNGGEFTYANGRDEINYSRNTITPGILNRVSNRSGQDLLDLLFNPETDVIGKYYAGTGNYLFQYMDSNTANYDGEHDGYYYLDARLNAASYNQTAQRFYLYDYLERTSDSAKDGGGGQYSDILPFNSPYIFGESDDYNGESNADRRVDYYNDNLRRPGWEYDAKDGGTNHPEYNTLTDATTNYFFGIRTDIEFFLPNDAGSRDEYGNYGNISTRGEHMIFDFHGDDDVWVFVDGELVLDIGGMHGIMHGQVDFSSGTVITGADGSETVQTFQQLLGHTIKEGTHTMTVYYMERGSSQANCAIYFNIAPRYDLEITKEDIVSAEKLDGAVFAIYNDEALTSPAQLWESEEAHNADMEDGSIDDATHEFTVVNGIAKCWGISAGKTYYIYEKTPPPGYPESDDIIRITLNNRGTATIETTTLHGPNGVATEGFAVIRQDINDTLKIVALTVTNQKDGDTTEVRVVKTWAEGSTNLPESITVYLTADGVPVGRRATLNEGNGWSYTWTGLPKYKDEGVDQEIIYEVQEVLVPGYITTQGESIKVEQYEDWIRVDQMSDSKTYLLVHNGQALTYNGSSFGWMDPAAAEAAESTAAQWTVTTDHDGFHLKNRLGYTLTFDPVSHSFYGIDSDNVDLNQVVYYLNSRLVFHDHDVYYQFGANGTAVADDGLAFTLYQQEIFTGWMTGITNVPVEEEDQTYVEVTKVWSDGYELHGSGSVIVRLYADGKDTGRYVVLNAANNWTAGFYDLPYYQEDGETVVVYTVVEDQIHNYRPEYSDAVELPALTTQLWVEAPVLQAGDTLYRFTSGSSALAVDAENDVVSAAGDLDDAWQQWKVVDRSGTLILQNVGSGRYLVCSGTALSTSSNRYNASAVSLDNGYVKLGSMYLELTASHAGATNNSANVTNQHVTHLIEVEGQNGTGYTVTNLYGVYTLPVTGGMGPSALTFGGLLILAAALMYISNFGRKRQKGGR